MDPLLEDQDNEDDCQEAIVMAVNSNGNGDFGCCYFVNRESNLFVMSDVQNGNLDLLNCLKAQIQPTIVILPLQITEQIELRFRPQALANQSGCTQDDGLRLPYELEYRQFTEFLTEPAKKRLSSLPQGVYGDDRMIVSTSVDRAPYYEDHDGHDLDDKAKARHGRYLSISAAIDFESQLSIGCAGAVLAYIARHKKEHQLLGCERATLEMHVSQVQMFRIDSFMFINEDTQASLQILRTEPSPNAHSQGPSKGASGGKEGLSIFGLFKQYSRTPQGKHRLRQLLSQPSLDPVIINERLDTIDFFVRAENDGHMKGIRRDLGHIKNVRAVLGHLRKGINNASNKQGMKTSVWSALRSAAFHSLQIKDAFCEMTGIEHLKIGSTLLKKFDSKDLADIGSRINTFIDFEKSEEMHRTVIAVGIDPDLDQLRYAYDGMDHLLNRVSREIASEVPETLQMELRVIFFPQIGFLISLPLNKEIGRPLYAGEVKGAETWDPVFTSFERQYFKEARMRDLDGTWGDVYASICDKQIELLHRLATEILKFENLLTCVSDICGELDCLLAFAMGARCYGFHRPHIVTENVINIKNGRHPLQELCVSSFVPNDTFIVGGPGSGALSPSSDPTQDNITRSDSIQERHLENSRGPSMIMMTGPNFSGKSVYLKQVAIIVYLAHVGCFVPAARATIGLTDAIMTRVTARDTVSRIQSTFMVDVQQTAMALRMATRRSLILIDELGKGTEVSDGIGIASGVYNYVLSSKDDRPKVLAATHFHEIFETGSLVEDSNLAFSFMEINAKADVREDQEPIVYLYTVRPGRSNSTHGAQCASSNGIDSHVIARAEYLGDLSAEGEDLVAACTTISELEEAELRKAEEIARDFLAQNLRPPMITGRLK